MADGPLRTPEQFPGVKGADGISRSTYSEKLLIGYRWYQEKNIEPLFPFGYGQSYTSFAFSDLTVTPTGDGATVSVKVKNTGSRAGAEVAQAYVKFPRVGGRASTAAQGLRQGVAAAGPVLDGHASTSTAAPSRSGTTAGPSSRAATTSSVGSSSADLPLTKTIGRGGASC